MAVAASRLIPSSKPLQLDSFSPSPSPSVLMAGAAFQRTVEKKRVVVAKASSVSENVVLERETTGRVGDLVSVVADVAEAARGVFKRRVKRKSWQLQAEMIVESGIINCRFFTLFGVAGSLVGSILCFIEGCFLILKSFYEYFRNMQPQTSDHKGEVMQLLVEALDLFLVGNAMLVFGMGIYVMFVGSKEMKRNGSNFFGLFHLKRLPPWMDIQSLSQAKSRIGHSVLLILQAGVMDKLKNVPIATALDLACLAGTILLSSACIFLLSRLSTQKYESR